MATGGSKTLAVFPLKVSGRLAKSMAPPEPPTLAAAFENSRGLRGISVRARPPAVPAPTTPEPPSPPEALSNATARALVESSLNFIVDPTVTTTRGLQVRAKESMDPLPVQRVELLGDIFLPAAARKMIKDSGAKLVIVIPDGPLHKLPLETLVLGTDKGPKYLLEELPPVVYAPSSGILAYLVDRPRPVKESLSLLTVGNPEYPQTEAGQKVVSASRGQTSFVVGFRGQLPLLEGSAHESQVISKFFPGRALMLAGKDATEKAVVTAMRGKQVIHIAAHGFADDRFGNLFGALATDHAAGEGRVGRRRRLPQSARDLRFAARRTLRAGGPECVPDERRPATAARIGRDLGERLPRRRGPPGGGQPLERRRRIDRPAHGDVLPGADADVRPRPHDRRRGGAEGGADARAERAALVVAVLLGAVRGDGVAVLTAESDIIDDDVHGEEKVSGPFSRI